MSEQFPRDTQDQRSRATLALGAILILLGGLLLAGQLLGWSVNWDGLWPLFVLAAGGAFWVGMFLSTRPAGGGLAIPASILTMIGLILLAQNLFGWWDTWSYAWALIVVAVGLGIAANGQWSGQPAERGRGLEVARTGLILFVIFGALFEILFGMVGVGDRRSTLTWPVLIILLGSGLLVWRLFRLVRGPQPEGGWRGDVTDLGGPVVLIGIGVLALLVVQGRLPAQDVLSLLNLWPLLLVTAGVQLLFGRRSPWISGLMGLLLVAAMAGLLLYGERLGLKTLPAFVNFGDSSVHTRLTGSGTVTESTREVTDFDQIILEGLGDVTVVQGDKPGLVISAEDNLLPHLISEVRGRQLMLSVERGYSITPRKPIRYTVSVSDLRNVEARGAGSVSLASLQTDDLSLTIDGAGSVKLEELQADSLQVEISGAGSVQVGGAVQRLEASMDGVGSLHAGDLSAVEARVEVSGLGSATLWVTDSLDVRIDGTGSVRYYGSPSVSKTIDGLGSLTALGNK